MSLPPNPTAIIYRLLNPINTRSEASKALHKLIILDTYSHSHLRQALASQSRKTADLKAYTTLGIFGAAATARVISVVRSYHKSTRTQRLIEELSEEKWKDLTNKEKLSEIVVLRTLSRRRRDVLKGLILVLEERGRGDIGVLVMDMLVQEAEVERSCEELLRMEQKNRKMVIKWAGC